MSVVEGIKTALERELRGLERTEGQSASAYEKIKVSKEAVIKTVAARLMDYKFQLANARSALVRDSTQVRESTATVERE